MTEKYLADPALAEAVREAPLPEDYRACWGARTLSRPLFVDGPELRRTARDCQVLLDLLLSLPRRAFGGELDRYCATLGIAPDRARLLARTVTGAGDAVPYGRADLYHDGSRFRLLEFNVASDLGGADRAELPRALLAHPGFAAFAAEQGLDHVHTGERIAAALRSVAAPVTGGGEPSVGLVCAPGGLARHRTLLASFTGMLRRLGVPVVPGELDDLDEDPRGPLRLSGERVDVVLRFFTVDDVCDDRENARRAELAVRAHEEGRAVLWTPLDSTLYSNKGTLALLCDPLHAQLDLTPEERALVDRLLPWTRIVAPGPAVLDGREDDLLTLCRRHRSELILKPLRDCGGSGLVAGWECDEQQWAHALQECLGPGQRRTGGQWIVQRRVTPAAEPVRDPESGSRTDWAVAWGMFFTPQGYAGADARVAPYEASAVINYGSNPLTRTTGVFSVG